MGNTMATRRDTLRQMLGIGMGLAAPLELASAAGSSPYRRILSPRGSHPALQSAAKIMAERLRIEVKTVPPDSVPEQGEIALAVNPAGRRQKEWLGPQPESVQFDGYLIVFHEGAALVRGNRPRSLLYAAGDLPLWKDRTTGTYLREPSFELRVSHGSRGTTMAEAVALTGANLMQGDRAAATLKSSFPNVFSLLSREDQERLLQAQNKVAERSKTVLQECRDADVPVYTSIYGNNFQHWSPALYEAVIKAYPSAKGVPHQHSWEKAPLCPSDPMTWKIIDAYIRELMEQSGADGFMATFWDQYGMFCHDPRCIKDGLDKFPNEVYLNVKNLYQTVNALGKKLIVRTWSSGCPHWLGDEYVHAPGYGHFGGTGEEVWGRVIKELPAAITLQTKVYNCDVEPDPSFSPLIGETAPHNQIAEYQIIGQTTGRYYFPASSVNYNTWTMKKALRRIGAHAGVSLGYGATRQTNFSLPDDIVNGINLYAAREISWNIDASLGEIWKNWATPIYGEHAAPHIIRALQLSEDAANRTFSVLGMGSSTNSDFVSNIARRETLLRYTNRYYLPEYAQYLEPTKQNIERVIAEKQECMQGIEEMFKELSLASAYLRPEQKGELETRFKWLQEFAICRKYLDISLWRYRYLRHLAAMLTTEPEQMKDLAEAYDEVAKHSKLLFQYDPNQKFSCYNVTLGELRRKPALGDPMPLMKQLYDESKRFVEDSMGPGCLPKEWIRA